MDGDVTESEGSGEPDTERGDPDTERDLAAVEAEFQEKLDDVRERVIQVKREADGKAAADHEHDALQESISELRDDVDALDAEMDAVRADLDTGFENFEEILESLTNRANTLENRTERLAGALIGLRDAVEALSDGHTDPLEPIARAANRNGIKSADCEACSASVDISLLRQPRCPHCEATFSDLQPSKGWFGSATLIVGDPPALTSGAEDNIREHDIENIAPEEEP